MKPEVIEVHDLEIACNGPPAPGDHPIVFLHIDGKTGKIHCPYCNRLYVMKTKEAYRAEP